MIDAAAIAAAERAWLAAIACDALANVTNFEEVARIGAERDEHPELPPIIRGAEWLAAVVASKHLAAPTCRCSISSAAVLEIIAETCSNCVILGERLCSLYVTLCSNYLIGARHRRRLLKIRDTGNLSQ
jgi:hypothetical protein